jgi:hypothetical protein
MEMFEQFIQERVYLKGMRPQNRPFLLTAISETHATGFATAFAANTEKQNPGESVPVRRRAGRSSLRAAATRIRHLIYADRKEMYFAFQAMF